MKFVLLGLLVLLVLYSRFLNLNWDDSWGFHPDENNLWAASRRVELFSKLDPKFYAYGGFPIYLYSFLTNKTEARVVSAAAQALIVILLFVIGKRLAGWPAGFLAAAMATLSAGLMQAGHFLTVESLVGLFTLLLFWCVLNHQELLKVVADRASSSVMVTNAWLAAATVVLGLGIGTKVSFAVFGLIFFGRTRPDGHRGAGTPEPRSKRSPSRVRIELIKASAKLSGVIIVSTSIFLLTNPFIFSKWRDVRSAVEYEAKVVTRSLPVFYTRQFIGTVPGWFQATGVFPYISGWLFLPMVLIGAFVVCFKDSPYSDKVQPWRTPRLNLLILAIAAALLSFLPFWAKWTRYVVQVLPIFILIAGIGAGWLWEKGKIGKTIALAAMISFLPQFFSTLNVYANEDTRIAAAKWADKNISKDAKIFTEAMDLGILPLNPAFGQNIKLFNFYELDDDKTGKKQLELSTLIDESEYFILLSRRVYKNSIDHPDKFPRASDFYRSLFDGSLGYKKIYEYSSAVIPAKAGIYLDRFRVKPGMTIGIYPEETFEVFDNPKVIIFEKQK